jgi:hypothetical protein
MNNEFLKLTGRVAGVNAGDQSFVIESTKSSNRLRVYADNALFKKLDHVLTASQFHGGKAKEITGTFYIQGRVLVNFRQIKPMAVHINTLCLEINENCHPVLDFIHLITRAVHQEPSK